MGEFKIFEKFKEQVVVIDENYRIIYANEAYIKENGFKSKEEVIGKPCYTVSHKREEPCDGECHPCPLKEIQKRRSAVSVVHTHYTHDNKEVHVEICAFPIEEGKKIIQFIKNIKNDKEKFYLFSLSQKLSSVGYLALGVAHQLNTPLTTISLALEELEKKFGKCEEIEVIKNALQSCKTTVDKLLLFARKDNTKDLIDVKRAVEDVLELLKVYARERGVELEKELENVYMLGNETDIRHIVLNLVLNAIQASDKGKKVKVSLKREDNNLVITVEDEGKGIPPEEVDKIFLPFYHGKDKREGSGLGLAIVNDIVKSYGGKINLRSSLGKGSVFEVYLPFS